MRRPLQATSFKNTMSMLEESVTRRKFTVDEFYQMSEAGFFNKDPRVELVEGQIINVVPIGSYHAAVVSRLTELFMEVVAGRFILSVQGPLKLNNQTVLQPDFQVLRRRTDFYAENIPTAADVHLIIEVADSSLKYDSGIKLDMYSKAGTRHYCLVNTQNKTIDYFLGSKTSRLALKDKLTVEDGEFRISLEVTDIFPVANS